MKEAKADWVKLKPNEVEKLVVELAKQGDSPAKIGLILRDKHGIPKAKLLGKRIGQILKEAKIQIKSEKDQINDKIKNLEGHISKNKHDNNAKKALTKDLWVLHKIEKQNQN